MGKIKTNLTYKDYFSSECFITSTANSDISTKEKDICIYFSIPIRTWKILSRLQRYVRPSLQVGVQVFVVFVGWDQYPWSDLPRADLPVLHVTRMLVTLSSAPTQTFLAVYFKLEICRRIPSNVYLGLSMDTLSWVIWLLCVLLKTSQQSECHTWCEALVLRIKISLQGKLYVLMLWSSIDLKLPICIISEKADRAQCFLITFSIYWVQAVIHWNPPNLQRAWGRVSECC